MRVIMLHEETIHLINTPLNQLYFLACLKNNKLFDLYCKNFEATKKASYSAHRLALEHLQSVEISTSDEPIKNEQIEFEISDDLLQFYEESLKFKKEKSL